MAPKRQVMVDAGNSEAASLRTGSNDLAIQVWLMHNPFGGNYAFEMHNEDIILEADCKIPTGLVWLKYAKNGALTGLGVHLVCDGRFLVGFEFSNQGRGIENWEKGVRESVLGACAA